MGEQGAESLHASFNTTERAYANMTDQVQRLKVVLLNHHLRIQPKNTALEPPLLKKRPIKKMSAGENTDRNLDNIQENND